MSRARPNTIGFVVAMREETRPFLRAVGNARQWRLGRFPAWSFRMAGSPCVLLRSGIGAKAAGEATCALVHACAPSVIVSFGVSGAVGGGLQVGDIVAIERVCRLSEGRTGPVRPLASWSPTALAAARATAVARGSGFHDATAATTSGEPYIPDAGSSAHSLTVDMETWAIVEAAASGAVPVLSMRAISDSPDAPLPFSIGSIVDERGRVRMVRLLVNAARSPRLLQGLLRVRRNMRRAMGGLVASLLTALEAEVRAPSGAGKA